MSFFKNLWHRIASSASVARPDFGTRLYEKLADNEAGKNLFLSPFSIQVALAMCAAGAKGETRRVMADLIGAPENVEEQNLQYAALLKSVMGDGQRPFQLLTANALWGSKATASSRVFRRPLRTSTTGPCTSLTSAPYRMRRPGPSMHGSATRLVKKSRNWSIEATLRMLAWS